MITTRVLYCVCTLFLVVLVGCEQVHEEADIVEQEPVAQEEVEVNNSTIILGDAEGNPFKSWG